MNALQRASLATQPHYLFMLKLYVKPEGTVTVVMGNSVLEVDAKEVQAMLDGMLSYAEVFKGMNGALETSVLQAVTSTVTTAQ